MGVQLCDCNLCIDLSMDMLIMLVKCLLNEFSICFAVVAIFVLCL